MNSTKVNLSWREVDKAMSSETNFGYKVACIEARKIFIETLKINHLPHDNLLNFLKYFGWKFTQKEELKKAIMVCEKIISTIDYNLSTFESEDAVQAFRQAVVELNSKDSKLNFSKKLMISLAKTETGSKIKIKKIFLCAFLLILLIKFLTSTKLGTNLSNFSNTLFSYLVMILFIGIVAFIFVMVIFLFLDSKNGTIIKEIKEK